MPTITCFRTTFELAKLSPAVPHMHQMQLAARTLGIWRSAVSGAYLRPQWGQGTRSSAGCGCCGKSRVRMSSPRASAAAICLHSSCVPPRHTGFDDDVAKHGAAKHGASGKWLHRRRGTNILLRDRPQPQAEVDEFQLVSSTWWQPAKHAPVCLHGSTKHFALLLPCALLRSLCCSRSLAVAAR